MASGDLAAAEYCSGEMTALERDEGTRMTDGNEKVVIAAGGCLLTVQPECGGKISSLLVDQHELLQQPLRPILARSAQMAFEDSDASGWDECLPTVAACSVETAAGVVEMRDHGDLWRVGWRVVEHTPDAITMSARCESLPLELTRTMMLTETAAGWQLRLLYSLRNVGGERAPWSWAAHPLFACEAGDRIVLPEAVRRVRVEGSRGNRLGAQGDWVEWPSGRREDCSRRDASSPDSMDSMDLGVVEPSSTGHAEKLFSDRLSETDGWCRLERRHVGVTFRFDPRATPYLGLWLCYGGWPERGERQMCVAMEPTTAPTDALATMGGWTRWMEPGETTHWPMDVDIAPTAKIG